MTTRDFIIGILLLDFGLSQVPIMVYDINGGNSSSSPRSLTEYNNKLYFEATNGSYSNNQYGSELWVYDGTNDPSMVYDINTGQYGQYSSGPQYLAVFNNKLYFSASNGSGSGGGQVGHELWVYDGVNDPSLVYDIRGGYSSSYPRDLIVYNEKLYFSANGGNYGEELWVYDGVNDPSVVHDISNGIDGSSPTYLTVYNNKLYFNAYTNSTGDELWVYNGVDDPSIVYDIVSGSNPSNPIELTVFNDKLYFTATNGSNGNELWVYDGTNDPSMVYDINSNSGHSTPQHLTVYNDKLYFNADDGSIGKELWEYDGVTNPSLVYDIESGSSSSYPSNFKEYKDKLYFSAFTMAYGDELWTYYNGPTWHISTTGSDDNDGSEESLFATIQHGIDAAWTIYEQQSAIVSDAQTNLMFLSTTLVSAYLTSIIDSYFFSDL